MLSKEHVSIVRRHGIQKRVFTVILLDMNVIDANRSHERDIIK